MRQLEGFYEKSSVGEGLFSKVSLVVSLEIHEKNKQTNNT